MFELSVLSLTSPILLGMASQAVVQSPVVPIRFSASFQAAAPSGRVYRDPPIALPAVGSLAGRSLRLDGRRRRIRIRTG
jgi:hypothetical protein